MSKLSPFFSGSELVRSTSRPDLVIPFDEIPAIHASNLQRVVDLHLHPVRVRVGKLRVLGGYRSQALQDALRKIPTAGAASRSRHVLGLAVDYVPDFFDPVALFKLLAGGGVEGATWDRLALYIERDVPNLHVDFRPWEAGEQRRKLFVARPAWTEVSVDEALALAA